MHSVLVRALVVFVSLLFTNVAMAAENVQYQIDVDQPQHHSANVTVLFPSPGIGDFDVKLPAWRPGRYRMLPLANGISQVEARDSSGNLLQTRQLDGNTWRVQVLEPKPVEFTYRLYANELGRRTRHIDSTHAYLDAVATLVYSPRFRATPVTVELNVPHGWRSVSGLEPGFGRNSFRALNYDVLADSPIETGRHDRFSFRIGGADFKVVIWGKSNLVGEQAAQDLARMSQAYLRYWGTFPFSHYVFIIHATDGEHGATEHLNSTVIQHARWKFLTRKDYLDFLETAAHEFAHAWNVEAYRPAGLVPYDYQRENYSPLLWFAEGGTRYLDGLLLVRAGLMKPAVYLQRLSKRLNTYFDRPGRLVQSAAVSSFNEWTRPVGEQAWNDSVNIYTKGQMISLWLDLEIRSRSAGKYSIRDLHRRLFQQFPASIKGYTEADLIRILKNLGVTNARSLWQQYVRGHDELPLKKQLQSLGLLWRRVSETKLARARTSRPYLGIELDKKDAAGLIKRVSRGSPTWKAGLGVGDRLVALNGMRVVAGDYAAVLATVPDGGRVSVSFFRNDLLKNVVVKSHIRPTGVLHLKAPANLTPKQNRDIEAWLGKPLLHDRDRDNDNDNDNE